MCLPYAPAHPMHPRPTASRGDAAPCSFTMLVSSTEQISKRVLAQHAAFEGMHLELIEGAGENAQNKVLCQAGGCTWLA